MNHEASAIEKATMDLIADLNTAITHEYKTHHVTLPEKAFRGILAGYFERQSLREWCELLDIDRPTV